MATRQSRKVYTAEEALALFQALPDVDSGSSEDDSFICESEFIPTDSSSDEDVPTDSQPEQPLHVRPRRKRSHKTIIVDEDDEERSLSKKGKSSQFKQDKRHCENQPQSKKRRHSGEESSSSQKRKCTEQKSQRRKEKAKKSKGATENTKVFTYFAFILWHICGFIYTV